MSSLIDCKTVYLDIDDIYTYDYNGEGDRLVCVAYVDYDLTHWINVNKALLDEGHAVLSNFYNEFSPYSWSLIVLKDGSIEPTASPSPALSFSPLPSPTHSASPYPSYSPTPEPDSEPPPSLSLAVAIFAFIFVIVIFVIINRQGKK